MEKRIFIPRMDPFEGLFGVFADSLIKFPSHDDNKDIYNLLMKLTLEITKDFSEVCKLYRLMCFNVFAHNRDDHSKNFAYLYDEEEARFKLAPAYDLTYSNSLGGEHATTVNGNGANPGIANLLTVAERIGIRKAQAKKIASEIQECVHNMLGEYLKPI